VAFGRDALVERLPADIRDLARIASTPVRSATDIGAALRLASALFPDDAQKRIVLLSDGNDTTGEGQTEAALAAARGIRIETHVIGLAGGDEVLVERLLAPTTSTLGEEIEVKAEVTSTTAQPATARLFVDGGLAATSPVDLKEGTTVITFRVKPDEPGFHAFRVVVEAAQDTFDQNDRADASTIVKGEPRVLVAAGDETVAAQLVGALEAQGQQVETTIPELVPEDLEGLAAFDSIVLVDVPRLRLTDRQLAALQVYVRDLGRGLVMVGGPRSYGAGGYTKTPLEETLPVEMGVRDREKQPDVALVVVIDKSGSMDACHCNTAGGGSGMSGARKTDIGKEAILRAAAALTARDQLGIVAFNEAAHWVVRTAPLGDIEDLQGQLGSIRPEGQTNIFAGLDQAVADLEGKTASRRHIILLTDGWSTSGAYDAIVARMKAAGITLSTVGAGGGSSPFLEQLAKQGGGRFYNAVNAASIPDIFLKETEQVAGQQIIEERFFPAQTGSSPIIRGLDQGFPALLGYNGTTAKAAANTVLVSDRADPILAHWQYGLGRSVAWTSDATGRWAAGWLGWTGFEQFFSQLVAWTFPGEETGGIDAEFVARGTETVLRISSADADGSPRDFYDTLATLVGPDIDPEAVQLVQVAPGVYEASLGEIEAGGYLVRVTQTRPGDPPLGRTLGLVAPTAAEYRQLGTNEALLTALRAATGGTELATPADAWVHDLRATTSLTALWPSLLVAALLLWPLDIALRRVSVGRRELVAARGWVRTFGGRRGARAASTATASGLLAARDRAGSSAARMALLQRSAEGSAMTPAAVPAPGATGPAPGAAGGASTGGPATPTASSKSASPAPMEAATTTGAPPSPSATPSPASSPPSSGASSDTIGRLREAKQRARER
jgi:uncharacterized membrane protein